MFFHHGRGIATSVHGDDSTSSGPKSSLDWLEMAMAKDHETTIGPRMGPGVDDPNEARCLNRVIRWKGDFVSYEADPRQVERLVAECGLTGSKSVATPGVKANFIELGDNCRSASPTTHGLQGVSSPWQVLGA